MKYAIHNFLQSAKRPFQKGARKKRMNEFLSRMNIKGGERIIDLGGAPAFWEICDIELNITIINLEGFNRDSNPETHHNMEVLVGDACKVNFPDNNFDIAFSNSVIEHVGDETMQGKMAQEIQRLAPSYWVQTPSIWFPIEAHTNMPFWWFYPPFVKRALISSWRKKLPKWTDMVEGTTVLLRSNLKSFFPSSRIWVERVFGFPKSYIVYKAPEA